MGKSHAISHKKSDNKIVLRDKHGNEASRPSFSAKAGGRRRDLDGGDSIAEFTGFKNKNDLASPNMQRMYHE